ncbi:MAG: tetratricopeptide repeat protein [Ramlibacter sp.]|nr:tetratricopeptide repeat protein [Ramlibacter sp.]
MQALGAHRYAEARAAFQRAVTADPSFAGAWLDLAIAAQAEGDTVQAEEFLAILEARFTLPLPIALGVHDLRQRIHAQRAAPLGWTWRALFQTGAGHDSNANTGLSRSDLTLTLPAGGVLLPLDPALRPQADSYAVASLRAEGSRKWGAGQIEVTASAKSRVNSNLQEFDTLEALLGAAYASTEPAFGGAWGRWLPGPWRVGVTGQQLRLGGNALLNSLSFSALHAWKQLPCSPQGGVEVDFRHFPTAANLDSRLAWVSGAVACGSPWAGSGGRLSMQLRAGWEAARGNFLSDRGRPGDNTRHLELTLSHRWSWPGANGTHRLEAQAQWAQASDTKGYSPLLSDNAPRRSRRTTAGVAYSVPLWPAGVDEDAWVGTLAIQGFRQRSNLEVFQAKGEVIQITVQKNW